MREKQTQKTLHQHLISVKIIKINGDVFMKLKRILCIILTIILTVTVLPLNFVTKAYVAHTQNEAVAWANSKIGTFVDYDGAYGAQCVDMIYFYYKYLGVSPVGGNAINYATNALPSGWQRIVYYNGFVAQPGDIAVFKYGTYGHVGIVTSANSSSMTLVHNRNQNGNGTEYARSDSYSYTSMNFYCVIRPDFAKTSISYTSITPDTYYIKNVATGTYLSVSEGKDVNMNTVNLWTSTGNEMKMVVLNAPTGYKIRPYVCASRLVNPNAVYVSHGNNVNIYNDVNDSSQWWQFEKVGNYYVIHNVQNPSCVLDAPNGATSIAYVRNYTGADSQKWVLEPVNITYMVDVNGYIDYTTFMGTTSGYGTFDVYINNKLVADDVTDYCEYHPQGTTYQIKDIKTVEGKCYHGITEGSASGTVGTEKVKIALAFASSHRWDAGTVTTQPTCEKNGVRTYKCNACWTTKTESISKTDHKWIYADIVFEAECLKDGTCYYTCEYCKREKIETVPATGHNYVFTSHTNANCGTYGYDTYICSGCGDRKDDNYTDPWSEHSYILIEEKPATYTSSGHKKYQCSVCNNIKHEDIPILTSSKGDVNQDGKITASDARLALRASAGLETLASEKKSIADMDSNGKITASDARKILRIAAGLDQAESNTTAVDFSKYCGSYFDGNAENGPCYVFDLISVDKNTNVATFDIYYVGPNLSPLYETEIMTAKLDNNGSASFSWTDSWGNEGVGTFTVRAEVTYWIELEMTVTKEADTNRATLATKGIKKLYPTSI